MVARVMLYIMITGSPFVKLASTETKEPYDDTARVLRMPCGNLPLG